MTFTQDSLLNHRTTTLKELDDTGKGGVPVAENWIPPRYCLRAPRTAIQKNPQPLGCWYLHLGSQKVSPQVQFCIWVKNHTTYELTTEALPEVFCHVLCCAGKSGILRAGHLLVVHCFTNYCRDHWFSHSCISTKYQHTIFWTSVF